MLRYFGLAAVLTAVAIGLTDEPAPRASLPQDAESVPLQTAPNPSFNVVNRTPNAISEVFATTAGTATWGRNRLVSRSVAPGQNAPIRLLADGNCIYDIRVVYANGQSDEHRGLNTCNLDNVIFPQPGGRPAQPASRQQTSNEMSFRLVNRGRSAVNEFYATLTGVQSWGEDHLGDDIVAPGATRVMRLPQGKCVYDVRIVYASGEASEKRRLDLCNLTDMRVP